MDSYGGNYEAVASGQATGLAGASNQSNQTNQSTQSSQSAQSTQTNGSTQHYNGMASASTSANQIAPPRRRMQRRSSMNTVYRPPQARQEQPPPQVRQEQPPIEPPKPERRGSMSAAEEKERRASIKAIMNDPTIPPVEKRKSIQAMMDGRRNSKERRTSLTDVRDTLATSGGNPQSVTDVTKAMEQSRPKCNHYARKCTIIAPCCGAAFGCRICHDECPFLPPAKYGVQKVTQRPHFLSGRKNRSSSLPSSWTDMPKSESHKINRFEIREIICRECLTRQTSKT